MTAEKKYIDFEKELTQQDQQRLEGERDTAALSSSQSRFMPGSKMFIWFIKPIKRKVPLKQTRPPKRGFAIIYLP
jgi:hypothetical protein